MHLKMDRFGINASGFDGMRGVEDVDQDDVVFGAIAPKIALKRAQIEGIKKQALLKKKHKEEALKLKKRRAQMLSEIKKKQEAQKKAALIKKMNLQKSALFKRAKRQGLMGYDFSPLMGNPLYGFGEVSYLQGSNCMAEGLNAQIHGVEAWGNSQLSGDQMGFKFPKVKISLPKISLPKIKLPTVRLPSIKDLGKGLSNVVHQAGKVAGAVSKLPAQVVDRTVRQVGGKNLVKFLDRSTGGTYSQALNVSQLPGKALAGQAITKKDLDDVKGLAIKAAVATAAVYGAGSIAGAASNLVQQQAAKELGKKVGGSAGSLIAAGGSLASGDVGGATKTFATEEAKRLAVQQAQKSLGKEAGSILAIGVAGAKGGATAAIAQSKDIAKEKAYGEVAKKTGLPIDLVKTVQSGKVPSSAEVAASMKKELQAAPDKLQAELKSMPDKIAKAPAAAKQALIQKKALIEEELKKRDATVTRLAKEHAEKLAAAKKKVAQAKLKVDAKKLKVDDLKKAFATAPAAQKPAVQEKLAEANKEMVAADSSAVLAVASLENTDAVMEAKKVSAANGQYGVRESAVAGELPRAEHPFIAAGLIPRKGA